MRLHGYCTECHKFKRVTVRLSTLGRGTPMGICSDCEDKRHGA